MVSWYELPHASGICDAKQPFLRHQKFELQLDPLISHNAAGHSRDTFDKLSNIHLPTLLFTSLVLFICGIHLEL
jgi:hypothetical protein